MRTLLSFVVISLLIAPLYPTSAHHNGAKVIDPPTISADQTVISIGQAVQLWATGCESGKVKWSEGQVARTIVVVPATSVTYSAYCFEDEDQSVLSNSINITVNRTDTIIGAEYFYNNDPGYGIGTALSIGSGGNISVNRSIVTPSSGLSDGLHWFYLRIKDNKGNWSFTAKKPVLILGAGIGTIQNITHVEYFFNEDPGFGNGNLLTHIPGPDESYVFTLDAGSLNTGLNILYIRVRDNTGIWSLTRKVLFVVMPVIVPNNKVIEKLEYYVDNIVLVEGWEAWIDVPISSSPDIKANFGVDISSYSPGQHTIYIRVKDNEGFWSPTHAVRFIRPENLCPENSVIYFTITGGVENDFQASESLTANTKISGSSTKVHYGANNNVVLLPGFEVEEGAVFRADVEGCEN